MALLFWPLSLGSRVFRFFSGELVNIDGRQVKVEICKLWSQNNSYFFENSKQ